MLYIHTIKFQGKREKDSSKKVHRAQNALRSSHGLLFIDLIDYIFSSSCIAPYGGQYVKDCIKYMTVI